MRVAFNRGSSLIEVLIATVVVAIVVTAIAVAMSQSVRSTAQSRYREVAIKLGQDLQESFKRERNRLGWSQFVSVFGGKTQFCFDAIPSEFTEEILASMAGSCADGQPVTLSGSSVVFYREATVSLNAGTMEITVDMDWEDDGLAQSLSSVQQLRDWD